MVLRVSGGLLLLLMFLKPAVASDDIKISLDKLFNLKVTSVSGTEMDLKKTPAAIYVITSEDFKKQGHLTIADALRAVPGLHVGKIDANKWSITSRGFAGRFANKLLVLIDGRSVYTPLFSGVFWEIQDLVLDDIDRIEVIRGPGATLWGANAVNGVINIVTKGARETQGGNLKIGIGDYENGYGHLRYGDQLSDELFYRLSFKGFNRRSYDFEGGGEGNDSWDSYQFGLRTDWYVTPFDTLTLHFNINRYKIGRVVNNPQFSRTLDPNPGVFPAVDVYTRLISSADDERNNYNFQFDWTKSYNATDGFSLKTYFDYVAQSSILYNIHSRTSDLDFRHWFDWGENNSFIYGLGFRSEYDNIKGSDSVFYNPESSRNNTYSSFVQNTTRFTSKWSLMLGSKFEHNDQTGFEFQPSARLTYEHSSSTVFWASFSRAVRRPSRSDDDLTFHVAAASAVTALPGYGAAANEFVTITFTGDRGASSEELLAYELGVRKDLWQQKLSMDLAFFYNEYHHLGFFAGPTATSLAKPRTDQGKGQAYGFEASVKYKASEDLDFMLNYSWLKLKLMGLDESQEKQAAENLVYLQMNYKLLKNVSWHTGIYYSDAVPGYGVNDYFNVDTGLIWNISKQMDLAIWGKNLTDPHTKQSADLSLQPFRSEVPRSFFMEFSYRF